MEDTGDWRTDPDRTRLVLGATGHRVLMELDKLNAGIDAALAYIKHKFPKRPLTVLSALAEGADRLIAFRVLAQPDAQLVVVLPLPPAAYSQDFDASSLKEFMHLLQRAQKVIELPPAPTRDEAYQAGGLYTLHHSDILIAIWDGKEPQGVAGTGAIAAQALEHHKPLVWIHAGNRKPGTMEPTTLGHAQGQVTYENF